MESFPSLLHRVLDRLAASRFLTVSLLFHLVLVLGSSGWVLYEIHHEKPGFQVEGSQEFLMESTQPGPPLPNQPQLPSRSSLTPNPANSTVLQTSSAIPPVSLSIPLTPNVGGSGLSVMKAGALTVSGGPGGPVLARIQRPDESLFQGPAFAPWVPAGSASTVLLGGIRQEGRRILFLLDTSGSMVTQDRGGKTAYTQLKQELIGIVDGLEATSRPLPTPRAFARLPGDGRGSRLAEGARSGFRRSLSRLRIRVNRIAG